MSSATDGPVATTAPPADRQKMDPALVRLTAILLTGAIPALLDTSIVNVAVDTIGRDLHTTVSSIQWVITGYLLSFGMVIPLSGWALARFGGRASWMFALSLFLAGSVASGASWSIGSLIAFRVLQGIGGGLLSPLLTTLIMQAAGGRSLGRIMATVSLPVAVVPILGPLVSGVIISNISWRWIFYVNVPICLAALVMAWKGLTGHGQARPAGGPDRPRPRLDITGLLLLCPALVGLLYGLAQLGSQHGFGHVSVWIPLAAGIVLLASFVGHALRVGESLIDLRLFGSRSFSGAAWLLFLAGLSIYGAMLLLPLYFQQARGYSALGAGLMMIPQGVGSILPRTVVGRLTDTIGPRPVTLAGVALAVMAGAFQGLARTSVPHASSATRIMQQVGGAFGAAVLAVILASQISRYGTSAIATAFGHTFWWCLAFTALAIVPALLLPGRRPAQAPRQ